MDYAFAPGSTSAEETMRQLFRLRGNTTLVESTSITRLDQFIGHLNTDGGVSRPIENMFICSHGNDSGWLQLDLAIILADLNGDGFPELVNDSNYEALVAAVASGAIIIPNSVINPRPPGTGPAFVHIKGCKIGQDHARPFVEKFKEALGGQVNLTAPKHYQSVSEIDGAGILEYLSYEFSVTSPTEFANRAALISAFESAGHTFIDGTPVPNVNWGRWVHRNITAGRRGSRFTVGLNPAIQIDATHEQTSLRLSGRTSFRHEVETVPYSISFIGSTPPTTVEARRQLLRDQLRANRLFDPAQTGFPKYQRLEFDSFDEFWDGLSWSTPRWNASESRLSIVGTRHKYICIVPICTDPNGDNNLIFNFYPEPGNSTPVINQLLETDTRLFLTV